MRIFKKGTDFSFIQQNKKTKKMKDLKDLIMNIFTRPKSG